MLFENTLSIFRALMQTYHFGEIASSQDKSLIQALSQILPVVLPEELGTVLSKTHIDRLAAILVVELPARQMQILRTALEKNRLQSVVKNMVQEYTQLITQVMSGKLQISSEATTIIKTQGLFKALEYIQMEHSSNNSESPQEVDFAVIKRREQLKALTRQMEYRSTHASPEFMASIKQEGPFTGIDYMQMEPAINKSLKSRQIFNTWNQTSLTGTERAQEICRPDSMLNIAVAMLTMGLKPENTVSSMPVVISQVKEAWYKGSLREDPVATTAMRGFNLVFGSVIELPVLIVKTIILDTGILMGRALGTCLPPKRAKIQTNALEASTDKLVPEKQIPYEYKHENKESVDLQYVAPQASTLRKNQHLFF